MAHPKFRKIKFGPTVVNGSPLADDKNGESEWFIEQRAPYDGIPATVVWGVSTPYNVNDAVLYNGISYNALVNNIGITPGTDPLTWKQVDGKDGDVWIQVPFSGFPAGGTDVEMYMKANGSWQGLKGTPISVIIPENPLPNAPIVAFEIPAAAFRYAKIEYTVKRGNGDSRKRKGTFEILNDGSSPNPQYSHEFIEIGTDVNVFFTVDYSSGNVRILYTTIFDGTTIDVQYNVKGWA
jgi:hypothetical protein